MVSPASVLLLLGLPRGESLLLCPHSTLPPGPFLSHRLWPCLSPGLHISAQSSRQHTQETFWPIQGLKPEGPRFSLPCSSHREGLMCHRNEFKAQKCTETGLPLLCPHLVHTHSRYSGVNTSACLGLGERWGKSWNFPKWYLMILRTLLWSPKLEGDDKFRQVTSFPCELRTHQGK